ncbi:MAG: hypothetical protein VX615_03140 [Planctomycetota bacterium]|nr:hypothetical protein [Planctomycetota bacterium]
MKHPISITAKVLMLAVVVFSMMTDLPVATMFAGIAIVSLILLMALEQKYNPCTASFLGCALLAYGLSCVLLCTLIEPMRSPLIAGLWVTGSVFLVGSSICGGLSASQANQPPWEKLIESLQLSDNAKRILYRDRELNLLRKTVEADLHAGDFHAALVHCDQMGTVFGAVEEAEALRLQVQSIIREQHEARIQNEMTNLQTLLDARKWVEAYQFAARLRRLFPESPLLHNIEQLIIDHRTAYRHQLEDKFVEAAKNDNPEMAMKLLIELDRYLTPEEARKFRDTADSVIATYRENLGARFKMAVSDHRWQEAIEFGEAIMSQFPNTKMAEEVKAMIETIQTRISEGDTIA